VVTSGSTEGQDCGYHVVQAASHSILHVQTNARFIGIPSEAKTSGYAERLRERWHSFPAGVEIGVLYAHLLWYVTLMQRSSRCCTRMDMP